MVDPQQVTRGADGGARQRASGDRRRRRATIAIHAAFDPYSPRVVLTVSDNGCGMDEDDAEARVRPVLQQPSPPAGAAGMGLAKALRWVEASGGSIRLESRAGPGHADDRAAARRRQTARRSARPANERSAAQS